MEKRFLKNIFEKCDFLREKKQCGKGKTQYVQNVSSAQYHQLHGKDFKVIWYS